MGTRSLTKVYDDDKVVACIYKQFDGYISGLGIQLAEFVSSRPFVNGIGATDEVFNGMGCFAAQLIAHLKGGAGSVYMYPADASDVGEEYVYEIRGGHLVDGEWKSEPLPVRVTVAAYGECRFDGSVEEFAAFCDSGCEQ